MLLPLNLNLGAGAPASPSARVFWLEVETVSVAANSARVYWLEVGPGVLGAGRKSKTRYIVRRGKDLLIFEDEQEAIEAQQAINEAARKAKEALARAAETSKRAARRARIAAARAAREATGGMAADVVSLQEMQALAEQYQRQEAMAQALRQQQYEEALRIWQELRDEEDDIQALMSLL